MASPPDFATKSDAGAPLSAVHQPPLENASDADTKAFPLALASSGERLRIAGFKTGKGLGKRLGGLGLHRGSMVDVVLHQRNGAVVLTHDNTRIALGAAAAQMIIVTLAPPDGSENR